jgi:sec-independent protein translocase protein TatB
MIGIGWTEMLVIGVVALIFIGPKELPALMQRMGKAVGAIRRMGQEFQREINRSTGLDQVTDLRKSITEPFKKTQAELAREFNRTTPAGKVEPTGVLKPADPKSESVVEEIKTAAGMTPAPASAASAAVAPAAIPAPAVAPAPAVTAPGPVVTAAGVSAPAPVKKTPRKRAAKAPVESPAPAEALAPAPVKRAPRKRVKAASVTPPADTPSALPPGEPPLDNG